MMLIAYRLSHIGPKNPGDTRYAMRDLQARPEPDTDV
jgi:hypothetical protein